MDDTITRARPNPAHYALAELEAKGFLTGIITQNVDNLHQAAGSKRVVEYHGNALLFVCDTCRGHHPRETLDFSHTPLYCLCGGLIRPDVVFFGEPIPPAAQAEAEELAQHCDLLLVIGTSGEVAPASYIPAHRQRMARPHRRKQPGTHPPHLQPHRPLPQRLRRETAAPGSESPLETSYPLPKVFSCPPPTLTLSPHTGAGPRGRNVYPSLYTALPQAGKLVPPILSLF